MEQFYLLLKKKNPLAWALMPHALERVKKFCVDYETDVDPIEIEKLIQQHFVSDKPVLMIAVGYMPGHGIFCHALACIDEITGTRFLTVMQFKRDDDLEFEDREKLMQIWEQLRVWGRDNGAKQAQLVTLSEKHVDYFTKNFGFKLHRYLMRQPLGE
jgi:hypothetical protein